MVGEERKTPRKEGEILRMKHTTLAGNLQEEMRAPASHLRERETKMTVFESEDCQNFSLLVVSAFGKWIY